jgi:flagellar protein FlaG
MDVGSVHKPGLVPLASPPRADGIANARPVRTELPDTETVQQVGEAEAVRFEPSEGSETQAAIEAVIQRNIARRTEIDRQTRDVIFKTVDQDTGEIIRQIPDDTLLRLRAFAREMQVVDQTGEQPGGHIIERTA